MGNVTAKTSGEIASFMSPAKTNIKSLKVHFSPKQLGTGDPSPENVREIVGWDGVEVNSCGKNLWKYGDLINQQNNQEYDFTYILMPNQEYTFSAIVESTSPYDTCLIRLEGDGLQEKRIQKSTSGERTFVTFNSGSKNYNKIRLYASVSYSRDYYATYKNIQLDLGSTATLYKPYQGNNISYQLKLPDEYQEVEYIESTGTQYIKTNYIPQKFDSIKCLFSLSEFDESLTYWTLFSAGTGTYQLILLLAKASGGVDGAYYKYFASGTASKFNFSPNIDTKYEININSNGIISCNDYTAQSNYQNAVNTPLYLMRRANNASPFKGKIYNFNIINNGINMINLVPCYRKSDNEIGMYDTISQTFYTNQGTGTFLKGNDVNKTFYGGYVDLISGELVQEYNYINIDYSNPWGVTTNYLYRYDKLPPSIGGRNAYVKTLCSHRINPFDVTAAVTVGTQGNISVGKKFCEMANIEMTSDTFNQYLKTQYNNGTPLQVCYLFRHDG